MNVNLYPIFHQEQIFKDLSIMKRDRQLVTLVSLLLAVSGSCIVPDASARLPISTAIAQTIDARKVEADRLLEQGRKQFRRGQYREALETYEQARQNYWQLNDKAGLGRALNGLGQVYNGLWQEKKALEVLQQALTIHKELNDRVREGETLDSIGTSYLALGQYDKGLEKLQQALFIRREVKDIAGEAVTLSRIGLTINLSKKDPKGLELLQQALVTQQKLGDHFQAGYTLWRIGQAYANLNDYSRSLEWLQKSLAVNHEVGNRAFEGRTLERIAAIYFEQKQYNRAINFYQQALLLIRAAGIRELEENTLASVGDCYKKQQQYNQAITIYQKALLITQELGNRSRETVLLRAIGNIYQEQKQYDHALDSYQQAFKAAQKGTDKTLQADVLGAIGDFYKQQNQYDKALAIYQQILPMFRELGDKAGEGRNLNATGYVYTLQKQYNQAIDYFQQALVIFRKIPDTSKVRLVLNNLGDTYRFKQEYQQAIPYYQEAIETAKEIPDLDLEAESIQSLGYAYVGLEDFPKAIETAEASLAIYQRLDKFKQFERLSGITSLYTSIGVKAFGVGNSSIVSQVASRTIALTQARLKLGEELNNLPEKAQILLNLGDAYKLLADYPNSLNAYEQALIIYQKINDKLGQISTLLQIMRAHSLQSSALREQGNYSGSFKLSNNSLALAVSALQLSKESNLSKYEKEILNAQSDTYFDLGQVYLEQGNLNKAEEVAQQALEMGQKAENLQVQNSALSLLGSVYASRGEYRKLREVNQRELALARQISPTAEAQSLLGISNSYRTFGDFPNSIEFAQQALQKAQAIDTTKLTASIRPYVLKMQPTALRNMSQSYQYLGEYDKALEFAQESSRLAHTFSDMGGEIDVLMVLGQIYAVRKDFQKAIALTQQAWDLSRTLKTSQFVNQPSIEQGTLIQLSQLYVEQEKLPKALELARLGLKIAQQSDNPALKINGLAALSKVYAAQGNISKAFDLLNQCAALSQKLPNSGSRGQTLAITAIAYVSLGDYQTSRALLQKALTDGQKSLPLLESVIWNALAYLSFVQGKPQETIKAAQKGIQVSEGRFLVLDALTNLVLSTGHGELGNDAKAMEAAQASLAIYRKLQDLNQEKFTLALIGDLHRKFGRPDEAITAYQTALDIGKTRDSYGVASNNAGIYAGLARIYADRNEPATAIAFYKQAINGIEGTRRSLQGLSTDLQKSFLQSTIDFGGVKTADIYRQMADLLISQGRLGEAQQVLELLKVQELNDLNPGTRTAAARLAELALNPTEQEIQKQYTNLIAFGQRVRDCKQDCSALKAQRQKLFEEFENYQQTIQKTISDGTLVRVDERNKDFIASASNFVKAQSINTVLIYPLVLPDKIHLLWASQGGVLSSTTCPIGEKQLTRMAADFQSALQSPSDITSVKQQGKALYDCLIKPLEEKGEWEKNNIHNLVIAPDRAINYIPLGALFDGKQFLIERYSVSNILNAGLTKVGKDDKLPPNPSVLGIGISERLDKFAALPDVKQELQSIVRSQQNPQGIYQGNLYLDQASVPSVFEDNLGKYQIIHIATHGEFNPSTPNQSYLLFSSGQKGKGVHYTVSQIQQQEELRNVYLVVLSACQTGKGESALSGIEIQGMSAAFVRDRARAVIASLWNVDDTSTKLLMQRFYQNLATGKLTKVEALRQAQLSLLQGKPTKETLQQRATLVAKGAPQTRRSQTGNFSHPYYWAPFILTGNGL